MTPRCSLMSLTALFAGLAACGRTGLLDPRTEAASDAGAAVRDAGLWPGRDAGAQPRADAGHRPDAGPMPSPDAGGCFEPVSWKLEPRTIDAVRLAGGGAAQPHLGASVTLEADVQLLSNCEELAHVDVSLSPGGATDFVALAAFAWVQQDAACEPVAPIVSTGVLVPGRGSGNLRVVVTDAHSPGGGMRLDYEVVDCGATDCRCDLYALPGPIPEFGKCVTDCDCAAELSCLNTAAGAPSDWQCRRPCTRHTDCPQSGCTRGDAPFWVCGGLDACPVPEDCPPGFSCVLRDSFSFCGDERSAPTSTDCECDAQCAPGERCILGSRATPTCEIPCAGARDCPFYWLSCATPGFCILRTE
ncbi:MAG: hypothetical protein QM765_36100 [Myxococcales bacterium]